MEHEQSINNRAKRYADDKAAKRTYKTARIFDAAWNRDYEWFKAGAEAQEATFLELYNSTYAEELEGATCY